MGQTPVSKFLDHGQLWEKDKSHGIASQNNPVFPK